MDILLVNRDHQSSTSPFLGGGEGGFALDEDTRSGSCLWCGIVVYLFFAMQWLMEYCDVTFIDVHEYITSISYS